MRQGDCFASVTHARCGLDYIVHMQTRYKNPDDVSVKALKTLYFYFV
jgi:hypothetical protein